MGASLPEIEILDSVRSDEVDGHGHGDVTALAVGDRLVVQGWVMGDPMSATYVEAVDDETVVARAVVNQPRPDVAQVYPDIEAAERSGFRMDIQAAAPGRGSLEVRAYFDGGASAALGQVAVEATSNFRSRLRARGLIGSLRGGDGSGFAWKVQVPGQHFKVLRGKDGWLFLRNDSNDVLGQHTGRVSLQAPDRRRWEKAFTERSAAVARAGVTWLFVIAPDKEAVYPEYLPADIHPVGTRPVHDVLAMARRAGVPSLYLLDAMIAGKRGGEVYSKTDTHWNYRGAFLGYQAICENLRGRGVGLDEVTDDEIEWGEDEVEGDLGSKLDPPVASRRPLPAMPRVRASLVYDNAVQNHGRVKVFERDLPGGPTCIVFGESFAEGLLIFLRESFRRLVFVHTSMLIPEVVEREQPDVVLGIPIERFLVRAPDDEDSYAKLEALAARKGGGLPWPAA